MKMKLITSKRNELVPATPDDPRCKRLLARYGDTAHMMRVWSPAAAGAIAARAGQSEKAPSLVIMMLAYGSADIALLLEAHVTAAVKAAGLADRFSEADRTTIAKMMTEAESLRTLNMAYLLRFFVRLAQGECELFGYTPYAFMRAVQAYARTAHEEQWQMLAAARKREEDEQRRLHAEMVEEFKRELAEGAAGDPVAEWLNELNNQNEK